MGTIILLQLLIILLIVIAYRSHKEKQRLITLHKIVLEMTADLIEYRDSGTGGHTHRTSLYLKIFIEEIIKRGLYKKETALWNIDQLIMSAQLHDVGKIMIDDNILRKPSQLTDEEFAKMKEHTTLGADIIQKMQLKTTDMAFLNDAKMFALYHHEKWDGTGYPQGIKGEEIPLPARLMTIIDFYDALTSKRSYKEPFTHQQTLEIIASGKGKQFDPALTDLFLSIADKLNELMAFPLDLP
jgi:putative two-component system response regulator